MIKQDRLSNELSNWEHFLLFLDKISRRANRQATKRPQKEQEVSNETKNL